jgi:hypothetical protein
MMVGLVSRVIRFVVQLRDLKRPPYIGGMSNDQIDHL